MWLLFGTLQPFSLWIQSINSNINLLKRVEKQYIHKDRIVVWCCSSQNNYVTLVFYIKKDIQKIHINKHFFENSMQFPTDWKKKKSIFSSSKQKPSIFLLLILAYNDLQSLWNHRDISCEDSAIPESCTLYSGKTVDHDVGMNLKAKVAVSSLLDLTWASCLNSITCFSSADSVNEEEWSLKWV